MSDNGKPVTTSVVIDVNRNPEIEALRQDKDQQIRVLQDKLEQKEGLLATVALEKFQQAKASILERVQQSEGHDRAESLSTMIEEDPSKLAIVQSMYGDKESTHSSLPISPETWKPPSGGVSIPDSRRDGNQFKDFGSLEASTFDNTRDMVRTVNKKEAEGNYEAKLIKEQWWRKVEKQIADGTVPKFSMSACPNCQSFVNNLLRPPRCEACGYSDEAERKMRARI